MNIFSAEAEYRTWRRKAELTGEADPYDDEDLEWCYRNKVEPEKFVTDDELAGWICQVMAVIKETGE